MTEHIFSFVGDGIKAVSPEATGVSRRVAFGALIGLCGAPLVMAQQAPVQQADSQPSGGLEEIVVTANKHIENVQDVPISISAVNAQEFGASGVTTTQDISMRIAGLNFQTAVGNFSPYIRGVGTTSASAGSENSVATYVDGVLVASYVGGFQALNNIEQVEVDKGPQGTLFGRNTTGGVINITTRTPTQDFHTDDSLTYGNFDTITTSEYVSGGIMSGVAADLAVYYSNQGEGWGKNLFTGQDIDRTDLKAARSKWVVTPDSADTITLIGNIQVMASSQFDAETIVPGTATNWGPGSTTASQRPDMAAGVASGAISPGFVVGQPFTKPDGTYDIDVQVQPAMRWKQWATSLKWQHDFGFAQGTSISAYQSATEDVIWNTSPTPGVQQVAGYGEGDTAFTQELQLLSLDSSKVKWVGGLFYLNSNVKYLDPFFIEGTSISGVTAPGAPFSRVNFYGQQGTVSVAGYGQMTAPLTFIDDKTDVTVGLRETHETKEISSPGIDFNIGSLYLGYLPPAGPVFSPPDTGASNSITYNKLTYRFALDHHFNDDLLGYISYNRGFKAGGYNMIPPSPQAVNPEILDAYEIGAKSELLDRRIRLNTAFFFYNWSDLQVTVYENTAAVTENAAKAQMYGLDQEMQALVTDNLTLSTGVEWLKDKFTSYPDATVNVPVSAADGGGTLGLPDQNVSGNQLPYAPSLSLNVAADYVVQLPMGQLGFNTTYYYNSGFRTTADNLIGQEHYNLVNAQVAWTLPDNRTKLALWGKNLSNQIYAGSVRANNNPGGYTVESLEAPRTYGVSVEYKF